MKTIATAFIELAAYLEIVRFDDPDEAQGAEELVSWCLVECSPEERAVLREVALERASQAKAEGALNQQVQREPLVDFLEQCQVHDDLRSKAHGNSLGLRYG